MTYKGYTGVVQGVDEVNGVVYGWLAGVRDVISFQGATYAELVADFRGAIDDYLNWCAEDGVPPNVPHPGQNKSPKKTTRVVERAAPAPRRKVTAKSSKPSA